MEEIKLICKACGEETTRLPKPAPQNAREGKQPLFHCSYCKAVNLRDGTIRTKKSLEVLEVPQKLPEEKKEGSSGRKVLAAICLGIFTIVTFVFLKKTLKGQGSGYGNNPGDSGQTCRLPWDSIR